MAKDFDLDMKINISRSEMRKLMKGGDIKSGITTLSQYAETVAKGRAPVRTGNLRRSISHTVDRDHRGWYGRVGTNVRYAVFQELGTRHHPAHPFLRPALEAVREKL